ncbi:Ca2+ regulator and membrane fusion protein Fig1-domain-containing protein [Cercophora scortea]|uniref:Ca2+ regulator and membrane fusion protein Fig1-domain-containing protein n=1 Tax=Cercophora scortea TaxID=314031 RepID=A0AAE0MDI5_9PEZI|nr:Ca2+ regulator and membrane fusion protein Fig1-domain-containing protein [Cercophora scortea]
MTFLTFAAKIFAPKFFLFRLLPYTLVIPIILFEALSLSGCVSTSTAIPSLYIVSLRSSQNTTALSGVKVRLGYFGICADDGSTQRCQTSAGGSADIITANLFPGFPSAGTNGTSNKAKTDAASNAVVKDLVSTALDLQKQVFVSILAGAGLLFVVGLVFLFLLKRDIANPQPDKPRRSAIIRRGTFGMLFLSSALVFTAALATTETAGALQYSSSATKDAPILLEAGITLQVLQWMAFGFSLLFTLAVPLLTKSGITVATFKGEA